MGAMSDFVIRRIEIDRALRKIGGGITTFEDGRSRLYFRISCKPELTKKLTEMFGTPLSTKVNKSVWWCEDLQMHFTLKVGRSDLFIEHAATGGEAKGSATA